ncbi:APC family permease [Neobacillus sp. NPDC097160]|uniref:APC family permease n=1 Tax=Neobacillus sp. NPDC097160 TaxID=3364298 RepID=UPI0037F1F6A2
MKGETENRELKRTLGFFSVFVLGLSLMVPTTVFIVFGLASDATNGHVPLVYIIATVAMLFTVLSYANMVRVYPRAGSAYTYVQQAFNSNLGFFIGWGTLFDYIFFPIVYVLSITIYLEPLFPGIPVWIWVLAIVLTITLANIFNVKIAVSFSMLLLVLQLSIAVVFVALLIKFQLNASAPLFSWEPFMPHNLSLPVILSGTVILAYNFIGLDAVSTLAEETHNPVKTIPKAMISIALFIGIMYTAVSYFMQIPFPDISIFSNVDAVTFEIADKIGGMLVASVFLGILIFSVIVGGVSAQMGISRLLYAMGRDNVLPKQVFGYLHPRTRIPVFNIVISGVISMTAVFLTLDTAISIISFGAYTAFTFVNLSVIRHYIIKNKMRSIKSIIHYLVFPIIGILFIALLWSHISEIAIVLGLLWNCIGFIYLLFLTKAFKKPVPTFTIDAGEQVEHGDDSSGSFSVGSDPHSVKV